MNKRIRRVRTTTFLCSFHNHYVRGFHEGSHPSETAIPSARRTRGTTRMWKPYWHRDDHVTHQPCGPRFAGFSRNFFRASRKETERAECLRSLSELLRSLSELRSPSFTLHEHGRGRLGQLLRQPRLRVADVHVRCRLRGLRPAHAALAPAATGLQPTAPHRVNTSGTPCPFHQHCLSHRNAS